MSHDVVKTADRNFVLQQGLSAAPADECAARTSALLFQPRLVALIVLAGIFTQSPVVFAAQAVILWWCVLVPKANVFDYVYNRTLARRAGATRLEPARAPRRFAQGMAASFATGITLCLAANWSVAAWTLQAFMVLALAALLFLRLCLGSFVYFLVRGRRRFALDTLPWARPLAGDAVSALLPR